MRECDFCVFGVEDSGADNVEIHDLRRVEGHKFQSTEFHYRGMGETEICRVRVQESDDYIRTLKIFSFGGYGRPFTSFCRRRVRLFIHQRNVDGLVKQMSNPGLDRRRTVDTGRSPILPFLRPDQRKPFLTSNKHGLVNRGFYVQEIQRQRGRGGSTKH